MAIKNSLLTAVETKIGNVYIPIASTSMAGVVRADGEHLIVGSDGVLRLKDVSTVKDITQEFGASEYKIISQKAVTEAFERIPIAATVVYFGTPEENIENADSIDAWSRIPKVGEGFSRFWYNEDTNTFYYTRNYVTRIENNLVYYKPNTIKQITKIATGTGNSDIIPISQKAVTDLFASQENPTFDGVTTFTTTEFYAPSESHSTAQAGQFAAYYGTQVYAKIYADEDGSVLEVCNFDGDRVMIQVRGVVVAKHDVPVPIRLSYPNTAGQLAIAHGTADSAYFSVSSTIPVPNTAQRFQQTKTLIGAVNINDDVQHLVYCTENYRLYIVFQHITNIFDNTYEYYISSVRELDISKRSIQAIAADDAFFSAKCGTSLLRLIMNEEQDTNADVKFRLKNGTVALLDDIDDKLRDYVVDNTGSNPNLLINGDFRVNQRGASAYGGGNETLNYGPDRWGISDGDGGSAKFLMSAHTLFTTNGSGWASISYMFDKDFIQSLLNKHVTFTVSVNGHIESKSFIVTTSTTQSFSNGDLLCVFRISDINTGKIELRTSSSNGSDIDWVKLEIGSVFTGYSPRPYAEELQMCQYYYQHLSMSTGLTIADTSATLSFSIPLLRSMRSVTSPKYKFTTTSSNNVMVKKVGSDTEQQLSVSSVLVFDSQVNILGTVTSGSANQLYQITGGTVDIDCEIY